MRHQIHIGEHKIIFIVVAVLNVNTICNNIFFFFRSIIQRFNVSKGTAITAVRRVAKALCKLSQRYIMWPNEYNIEDIVYGFSRARNFPSVIGAIDGTHINIPAPKENPEAYKSKGSSFDPASGILIILIILSIIIIYVILCLTLNLNRVYIIFISLFRGHLSLFNYESIIYYIY